ncbi:pyruvate dehydrogenase E1 component subunit alpha type I [Wuchereria bancrofti]|uniref:Pyruvate dehydrogenase E1 component subunit alpha type I n=1 Tax=Wuchereria bancrofti TaxID=6293 RepID=J9FD43_WUCBA|nr:pyruvate dehydrogenase E1 component subunit alpha type I [Wuchereria bancrofti]
MISVLSRISKTSKLPIQQQSLVALSIRLSSNEASFQTKPYKLHRLESGPSTNISVTRNDALDYYRKMVIIRRMETAAGNLYKERLVRGFCHLYAGQEAIAVGLCASKDNEDAIITSYRCHAWTYLTGSGISQILSELTAFELSLVDLKRTYLLSGHCTTQIKIATKLKLPKIFAIPQVDVLVTCMEKGGSMHMYNKNFFGGNGIVGAQQALGAGLAFAHKYNKKKNVSYTLFGDGAANQGQLYEVINMCALWDLPCIFICENNGYGMGTPADRASAVTDYYTRGDYIPGVWADGMDVLAVRETIRWSREYCNAGKGPLMLEFATYRYSGHSMSDPGTSYRTRDEVQQMRKTSDPITGFRDKIIAAGLASEEELKGIDKEAKKEVDAAVNIARTEPPLPPESLYCDIYHNTPPQYVRGVTLDESVVQKHCRTEDLMKSLGLNA